MKTTFLTQAELSRLAGVPASRITASVEAGIIQPAGRAGSHKHSPVVFNSEDLPQLKEALLTGVSFKASAGSQKSPHKCRSAAEVKAKHAAIQRAAQEGNQ